MRDGIDPDFSKFNSVDQEVRKAIQEFASKVASYDRSGFWQAAQKLDHRIKLGAEAFSQPRRSGLIVLGDLKNLLLGLRVE